MFWLVAQYLSIPGDSTTTPTSTQTPITLIKNSRDLAVRTSGFFLAMYLAQKDISLAIHEYHGLIQSTSGAAKSTNWSFSDRASELSTVQAIDTARLFVKDEAGYGLGKEEDAEQTKQRVLHLREELTFLWGDDKVMLGLRFLSISTNTRLQESLECSRRSGTRESHRCTSTSDPSNPIARFLGEPCRGWLYAGMFHSESKG